MQARGVTQYRFAKDAGLGQATVSHIFVKKGGISSETLYKVAEAYPDLNIRWLITGKGEMLEKTASMEVSVSG
jgi:DNA-binding LacI/PurR family transcriptional regulator